MSGGNYAITTRSNGTVLTATIYNADHQNHVTNQSPQGTGGYSDDAAMMQTQTSPGTVGGESLTTALSGELERIRYVIAKLLNRTYWYDTALNFAKVLVGTTLNTYAVNLANNTFVAGANSLGTTLARLIGRDASNYVSIDLDAQGVKFGGIVGIGMTPVNVLDITQSNAAAARISVLNNNSGTGANAALLVDNGTSSTTIIHYGASFSTSGYQRQNGGLIQSNGAGGLTLNTSAAQPIYFAINNVEVARFDTSSQLLIGVTTPVQANTHSVSTGASDLYAWSAQNTNATNPRGYLAQYSAAAPNDTAHSFFTGADNVGVKHQMRANGGYANFSANNVNLSDERVKKDIQPAPGYLDKINAIEVVQFKYKDQTHDDFNLGAIAQQVEKVAPEFIELDGFGETPEDGIPLKTIYETDLKYAMLKAIQELTARVKELESRK